MRMSRGNHGGSVGPTSTFDDERVSGRKEVICQLVKVARRQGNDGSE